MGTTKLATQTLLLPTIEEKRDIRQSRPTGFSQALMTLRLCEQQPSSRNHMPQGAVMSLKQQSTDELKPAR